MLKKKNFLQQISNSVKLVQNSISTIKNKTLQH